MKLAHFPGSDNHLPAFVAASFWVASCALAHPSADILHPQHAVAATHSPVPGTPPISPPLPHSPNPAPALANPDSAPPDSPSRLITVSPGLNSSLHPASGSPDIVAAARNQIGVTTSFTTKYFQLAFPGGDPPSHTGACTDVVIRALRAARNLDLQSAVNADMKLAFDAYPKLWGLSRPDPNIDHRRVPNLACWFKRKGFSLPLPSARENFIPGDIVTCMTPPYLPHIMIISNTKADNGNPLVIHNIGAGTREEDRLFAYKLTGHFRLPSRPVESSGKADN